MSKYLDKWRKAHARTFTFRLFRNVDGDIIEHLEAQPNKTSYLKALIREEMKK